MTKRRLWARQFDAHVKAWHAERVYWSKEVLALYMLRELAEGLVVLGMMSNDTKALGKPGK